MRRVAIPIVNGRLSEFLGQCTHYEIFDINNGTIKSNEIEVPSVTDIEKMPEWASNTGVTDIITYKVDKRIIRTFAKYKINLYVGIMQSTPRELIERYINGSLHSNTSFINEMMNQNG